MIIQDNINIYIYIHIYIIRTQRNLMWRMEILGGLRPPRPPRYGAGTRLTVRRSLKGRVIFDELRQIIWRILMNFHIMITNFDESWGILETTCDRLLFPSGYFPPVANFPSIRMYIYIYISALLVSSPSQWTFGRSAPPDSPDTERSQVDGSPLAENQSYIWRTPANYLTISDEFWWPFMEHYM